MNTKTVHRHRGLPRCDSCLPSLKRLSLWLWSVPLQLQRLAEMCLSVKSGSDFDGSSLWIWLFARLHTSTRVLWATFHSRCLKSRCLILKHLERNLAARKTIFASCWLHSWLNCCIDVFLTQNLALLSLEMPNFELMTQFKNLQKWLQLLKNNTA